MKKYSYKTQFFEEVVEAKSADEAFGIMYSNGVFGYQQNFDDTYEDVIDDIEEKTNE